ARAADVEDDVAGAVEQVDAGPRRRAEGEVSLVPDASRACGGERDEICDRSRAAFLREADQRQQDFRGCLRVGKRAMARLHLRAEEVRELRERGTGHAPGE